MLNIVPLITKTKPTLLVERVLLPLFTKRRGRRILEVYSSFASEMPNMGMQPLRLVV